MVVLISPNERTRFFGILHNSILTMKGSGHERLVYTYLCACLSVSACMFVCACTCPVCMCKCLFVCVCL